MKGFALLLLVVLAGCCQNSENASTTTPTTQTDGKSRVIRGTFGKRYLVSDWERYQECERELSRASVERDRIDKEREPYLLKPPVPEPFTKGLPPPLPPWATAEQKRQREEEERQSIEEGKARQQRQDERNKRTAENNKLVEEYNKWTDHYNKWVKERNKLLTELPD